MFQSAAGTLIASVAALILVGCGGPAQRAAPAPREIHFTEKEWAIEPKNARVAAGRVKMVVVNQGALEHNFVVEGLLIVERIAPGETRVVEINLKPGLYPLLCTLPGHREAGMAASLRVE